MAFDFSRFAEFPESVRRRILNFVEEESSQCDPPEAGPSTSAIDLNPVEKINSEKKKLPFEELTNGKGFFVVDGFLSEDEEYLQGLWEDAKASLAEESRPAQMGGSQQNKKWTDTKARGDELRWLNLENERTAGRQKLTHLMQQMLSIRENLQQSGFDVGGQCSFQLACYPGDGHRYARHADRSPSSPFRVITAIYYMNMGWNSQCHGGQLCLYPEGSNDNQVDLCMLISPKADRLVVFRSEMEHEVLPSFEHRYALTIWFKQSASSPSKNPSESQDPPLADSHTEAGPSTSAPCQSEQHPPIPPIPYTRNLNHTLKNGEIFVSVVSYRDPETAWTLMDLFSKADFPDRVHVGIVWQLNENVDEGFRRLAGNQKWRQNIREICIPHYEAQGPCPARRLIHHLHNGEEYFLQIDGHMRFSEKWDTRLEAQLNTAEKNASFGKAVLSSYPPGYEGGGPSVQFNDSPNPVVMCATHFDDDGMLRLIGKTCKKSHLVPIPSLFWAAGFSFSRSELMHEIQYLDLPFLFFGEELGMLAKMWTSGWDVFSPADVVLHHQYSRTDRHTIWKDGLMNAALKLQSQNEVKQLLCGEMESEVAQIEDRENKGILLGSVRTLEEFCSHIGIDFKNQTVSQKAKWGGLLQSEFAQ